MVERMKAALFYGKKEDMRIEEIPIPEAGEGDILLKVKSCGICGSDTRGYFNGIEERYKIPIVLGHELTGEVFKLGDRLEGYGIGDRVVVAPIFGCGKCEFCLSGKENLCENVGVFGVTHDGGFAEYMLIPNKAVERGVLVKIGKNISDEEGTMMEPLSCVLHGQRQLNIQPGDSVIIFGSGPIGLGHLLISKHTGAGIVGVADIVENRLKEAKTFGADVIINTTDKNWFDKVYEFFGKNGVDHVIIAAPSVSAIESGYKVVKKGGKLLIFGGLPHGSLWNMDPNVVHYKEVSIYGSIDSTIEDFRRIVFIAPSLDLGRFITHRFSLEDIKEGMEVMRRKEGLKVILDIK